MKKNMVLMICVIFTVTMFVGCGGSENRAMVGNWLLEDGQDYYDKIEDMKLLKDGTGIMNNEGITWKTENGRFFYNFDSRTFANDCDYKISGKILILIGDDGSEFIYKKYVDKPTDFGNWRSRFETDPITDNKKIFFRNTSSQGNIPLLIRWDGGKLEMLIGWGVALGSTRDVTFRIDDKPAETLRWGISTDNEVSFYPGDPLPIVKSLLDAKQVTVRCTPQGKSPMTAIFDITGFKEIASKYNGDLRWF